jgi:small conductance mechanosensitive channel
MNIDLNPILNTIWLWFKHTAPDIVIILIAISILRRFLSYVLTRIIIGGAKPDRYGNKRDQKLREDTLISLMNSVLKIVLWTIAGIMIFNKLFPGIKLGALGASAGILGIVVGFGVQSLVKDFIGGIYVVLENQYRIGDEVTLQCSGGVGVVEGTVVQISLRTTTVRDESANLHFVPNGIIGRAVNKTFDYAQINILLKLQSGTNLDSFQKTIAQIGQELLADHYWEKKLIDAPSYIGIEEFDDKSVTVLIRCKTNPSEQWKVEGELKRRLLESLEAHKIKLAG